MNQTWIALIQIALAGLIAGGVGICAAKMGTDGAIKAAREASAAAIQVQERRLEWETRQDETKRYRDLLVVPLIDFVETACSMPARMIRSLGTENLDSRLEILETTFTAAGKALLRVSAIGDEELSRLCLDLAGLVEDYRTSMADRAQKHDFGHLHVKIQTLGGAIFARLLQIKNQ